MSSVKKRPNDGEQLLSKTEKKQRKAERRAQTLQAPVGDDKDDEDDVREKIKLN